MPRKTEPSSSAEAAEFDLLFPPIPAPSAAIAAVVDEDAVRALVRHHHELLYRSSVRDLFPRDRTRFVEVVERIADFVVATLYGRTKHLETRGPVWFRSRHLPLTIDETARNVWLGALLAAFDDVQFPSAGRQELWTWVEALSIRAITRRTMVGQPRRYPLAEAHEALRPFVESARQNSQPRPS